MQHAFEDARAWCTLVRNGAGAGALRRLSDRLGDACSILGAGRHAWAEAGMRPPAIERLQQCRHPDPTDLAWLEQPGQRVIGWDSADYPALLRECGSPPAALFVCGDADLLWHPQLAIVGSRNATAGGRDNAASFAAALSRAGLAITSGLAAGVDAAAHLSALDSAGKTIAVVGTGPDRCYPRANAALAGRIRREGVLVSEHPPGTGARPEHFPSRNRIIAALSLGTLVVEAAERSGALISARLAADAGREVFALPGSIHNPLARGCHRLIRQGAALVESADEIVEAIQPLAKELASALRKRLGTPITTDQGPPPAACGNGMDPARRQVWEALGHDPVDLDRLAERTGLTVSALSSMLLIMELEGHVSAEHGRYARRR